MMEEKVFYVGSLFAGVGGIEMGFLLANQGVEGKRYEIVWSNEIDDYAVVTLQTNFNHKILHGDIVKILKPELAKRVKEIRYYKKLRNEMFSHPIDILTAGFPCQPFSVAGKKLGFEDPRGEMFWRIVDVVVEHEKIFGRKPRVLFLENVSHLKRHDGGNTYKVIRTTLEDLGYTVKDAVINTKDYTELPQNRSRIYILAFLNEEDVDKFVLFDDNNLKKHKIKKTPEQLLKERMSVLDLSVNIKDNPEYYYTKEKYPQLFMTKEEYEKLPPSKRPKNRINLEEEVDEMYWFYQIRRGSYVRKNKSGLCPALVASSTHPTNMTIVRVPDGIRMITPKEAFKIQGFPVDNGYKLPTTYKGQPYPESRLYKQAGNSVSVPVIRFLAHELLKVLD